MGLCYMDRLSFAQDTPPTGEEYRGLHDVICHGNILVELYPNTGEGPFTQLTASSAYTGSS